MKLLDCPPSVVEAVDKFCKRPNPVWLSAKKHSLNGYISPDIEPVVEFGWTYFNEVFLYRGATDFLHPAIAEEILSLKRVGKFIEVPAKFPPAKLDLNTEQQTVINAVKKAYHNDERPFGNYLALASTSVGKTILQASMAALFRQRTLVLCPTMMIMKTWEEDLQKLFRIGRDKLGRIQQSKWQIGEAFTLASPQTIHRRQDRWDELNELFGTVILDEVDGVCAPSLFKFMTQVKARYIIGATATATLRDGTPNDHLTAVFGHPVVSLNTYGKETQNSMSIDKAKVIETNFLYDAGIGTVNWTELLEAIACDEARNELIIRNVKKDWEAGRIVLVVTRLRSHADILEQMCVEAGITNVNQVNGSTNANRRHTDKLVRSILGRKSTCIVATQQAIQTGANLPPLDSLHITMPMASSKNLEQLLGRMRRKAEGKTSSHVTYYKDAHSGYARHLFQKVVIPTFRRLKIPGFNIY